jgi:hypothetical protein
VGRKARKLLICICQEPPPPPPRRPPPEFAPHKLQSSIHFMDTSNTQSVEKHQIPNLTKQKGNGTTQRSTFNRVTFFQLQIGNSGQAVPPSLPLSHLGSLEPLPSLASPLQASSHRTSSRWQLPATGPAGTGQGLGEGPVLLASIA